MTALQCRACGAPADAAVGTEAVAFTCALCLLARRGAATRRPLAAREMPDREPDCPEIGKGEEKLVLAGEAEDGRRVEVWLACGAYWGARPYYAVVGYAAASDREKQAKYPTSFDVAQEYYRQFLAGVSVTKAPQVAEVKRLVSPEWRAVRAEVLRRDGFKCRRCHTRFNLTVHHVKPRDEGGSDSPANLLSLCSPCHDWAEVEASEHGLLWADLLRTPTVDGGQG